MSNNGCLSAKVQEFFMLGLFIWRFKILQFHDVITCCRQIYVSVLRILNKDFRTFFIFHGLF